ncbi:MAG: tRNA pseudouridine(38-40) synthase TruA [Chloroflexi bacterium]|nr:tRNA pseudouridine(38-40) synthase TruA [Chloroflexota bacterium]MCL5026617.1 tRNA pseudouridine(38-40) synthase TruA [Chloroflexota bacterium]
MRNLMLVVEYDGTDYCGFQVQARGRTVQGELEAALRQVTGESIRAAGAGRTDAGAHALGQVVSFRTQSHIDADALGRALNGVLPDDVAVRRVREVGEKFHARHSAVGRWYRYTILNRDAPSALQRRFVHHIWHPLDVGAMDQASQYLVGRHDFRTFGAGGTTVRTVERACCHRDDDRVLVDLVANAFLTGMVRSIAGTLIRVGMGQIAPIEVGRMLLEGNRALAGPSVPAKGLCLMAVYYREADVSEYL